MLLTAHCDSHNSWRLALLAGCGHVLHEGVALTGTQSGNWLYQINGGVTAVASGWHMLVRTRCCCRWWRDVLFMCRGMQSSNISIRMYERFNAGHQGLDVEASTVQYCTNG